MGPDDTAGWGGRDRTSEWRNQNPLPYRLATPHQADRMCALAGAAIPVRLPWSTDRSPPFQPPRGLNFAPSSPASPLAGRRQRLRRLAVAAGHARSS